MSKNHRILAQIRDICAILSGLLVACDYRAGQRLVTDKEFKDNAEFFQELFEVNVHTQTACLCYMARLSAMCITVRMSCDVGPFLFRRRDYWIDGMIGMSRRVIRSRGATRL